MAEITQNYITLSEADHTPHEPFNWLKLKGSVRESEGLVLM